MGRVPLPALLSPAQCNGPAVRAELDHPLVVYSASALTPWLPLLIAAAVGAAGVWSVRALRAFDPLGISDARAYAKDKERLLAPLAIRGPYRYVRHPLYLLMLVLFWCQPTVTADRLLFNLLWTAWIIVATHLEERDLLDAFGEPYHQYQSHVPMLLPWPFRSHS